MYASLNGTGEAWVVSTSTKALFNSGGDELISFYPVVSSEDRPVDNEYPFTAIVGTRRYHLGSGTRSMASERIRNFEPAGKVEISPQDAARLKLEDDETVVVSSAHGTLIRAIRLQTEIGPGQIFVPTGGKRNEAMNLFELADLSIPGAAGWKTCEVKIEKA